MFKAAVLGFRDLKLGMENTCSDSMAGGRSCATGPAQDLLHQQHGISWISSLTAVNKK